MNRKFYFVDRNVISLIKESNDKKRQGIKRKILMLNKLKKSDRKNSYIIPFLSIREGQTGQIESVQSIKKTIKDDNKPLSQFFKEALIYDYSLDDQDYIATVLSQENNKRSERYTQFLVDCALLLYQPVKNTDKEDVKGLIIKSAKENEIPLAHHFVVCCLSVLYGNSHARKVLKPKKKQL